MKKVKAIKRADSCPFRQGSYSTIYDCLYHYRKHGINREALVKQVQQQLRLRKMSKPLKNILFDIQVVTSARPDRLSHPCIRKQSDGYEIIANGTHYQLKIKQTP